MSADLQPVFMIGKVYQILKYHAHYELIDVFKIADSQNSLIKQQVTGGMRAQKALFVCT